MSKVTEFLQERDLDYIVIEADEDDYTKLNLPSLKENKWFDSFKSGWSYRIDPPNPQLHIQRHVHVARTKHINAKDQQASWNQDYSSHDKKSFNATLSGLETAKEIARQALKLPPGAVLEELKLARKFIYLAESETVRSSHLKPAFLRVKL